MAATQPTNSSEPLAQAAQPTTELVTEAAVRTLPWFSVVGIGASAGGLQALQTFFAALPPDTGMAFVVILHLSPEYESALAQLLQTHTQMSVQQVTAPVTMGPNQVYVIPPAQELTVQGNTLLVSPFTEPRGQRAPIDHFFRTLAANHGDGAAIILSGTGSDGALGLQAIKAQGGLLLVQEPTEAEYDGMPRSAIATGIIDFVGPIQTLVQELLAYHHSKQALPLASNPPQLAADEQETVQQILTQVRVHLGHDFSHYKRATLLRRLARRLQVTHIPTLAAYLTLIQHEPAERTALFQDLLISVTQFFRDPGAFAALETQVIPALLTRKPPGAPVRVWVVGCATGEEAYSLAILLLEQASRLDPIPEIQIFASDLDSQALQVARQGRYPAAIRTDLSEARLARFFRPEGDYYQVTSELRECILFTQHNVLQDPPFSKLDLISCRNVLIYLERALQTQVFDLFAYALLPAGYLFLGSAEAPDQLTPYFRAVEKQQRLYQQQGHALTPPLLPSRSGLRRSAPGETAAPSRADVVAQHVQELEAHAPPSLLINEQDQILYISETAGRYLLHTSGPATLNVTQLIRPELQADLRLALAQVFATARPTMTPLRQVQFDSSAALVTLAVRPRPPLANQRLALVFFLEDEGGDPVATASASARGPEVQVLRVQMQRMQETYTVAQEELKAANEELQSTNEEYKVTLEELETGKEELQSTNEELHTLNQELRNKVEEVSQARNDFQNLLLATEIATLFLDRNLAIRRYTPRMTELLDVQASDRGRLISHLRLNMHYAMLEADAQAVMQDLIPVEREVASADGCWFLVRVRPYRTLDDHIDGVVITFVDISGQKALADGLQAAKVYAESIVETLHEPLLILDPALRVQSANPAFYTTFGVEPAASVGRYVYELGNGQWAIPDLRVLLEEVLPNNEVFSNFEVTHTFEQLGTRIMLLNARRLDHVQLILLAIEDITARKAAEQQLQRWSEQLEQQVAVRTAELEERNQELDQFVHIAAHDLRGPLRGILHLVNWITEDAATSLSTAGHDYLNKLRHRVQRMDLLLADLVTYAETGRQAQPAVRVDTAALVGNIVELLAPPAGFNIEVEGTFPILLTERIALETVLRNLISNAIKHHHHPSRGRVVMRAEVCEPWVEFQITDNGPGIAPADHTRIFELFQVLQPRDAVEGSGLGLAVVKKNVEIRGGTIQLASMLGQGATFRFTWPQQPLPPTPA